MLGQTDSEREAGTLAAVNIVIFLFGLAALLLSVALLVIPFIMLSVQKSILRELQILNMVMSLHEDDEDREATAAHRS
jgi:hypothetical protein